MAPQHVLRCDVKGSAYHVDHAGRCSITLPALTAAGGLLSQVVQLRLMCFTSCTGGLNRRPVGIVVAVELGCVLCLRSASHRHCAAPACLRRCA